MLITEISASVIRDTDRPTSNADETVIVSVTSDTGLVGYGEANACAPAVRAAILDPKPGRGGWDDGIQAALIGADLDDPAELYRCLKASTFWSCRAGIGHVAIAGVTMALWDLAGKARGLPVWRLLGERANQSLQAYATIYHGASTSYRSTLEQTLLAIDESLAAGFGALKVEAMPGINVEEEADIVDLATRARQRVGGDVLLLLDVGYHWATAEAARPVVTRLADLDLFALEAPLPPHEVDEHLRLKELVEMPIATGDQLTSAVEFLPLLEADAVDYVQAGSPRTGIDDMGRLAGLASERGRGFMPWGWVPTALSVAANLHACVGNANVPLLEYQGPAMWNDSLLRTSLAGPEPELRDGAFVLPTEPGLGVEIDLELLERMTVNP
jgi:L-alanine-DL-glutamate epimerase-like enolase superfamily enzyme